MNHLNLMLGDLRRDGLRLVLFRRGATTTTPTARWGRFGQTYGTPVPMTRLMTVAQPLAQEIGGFEVWTHDIRGLISNADYAFSVQSENDEKTARSRTLPLGGNFSVLVASCYYDGARRDTAYRDFLRSDHARDVRFKLLIGDNLYLDVHDRMRDPDFSGGWRETAHVYARYFFESGYREVLEEKPTFTTWDDHEFWNNYPERFKFLTRTESPYRGVYEAAGQAALACFQQVLNPSSVPGEANRSYRIDETPLVSFFVADTRSQRQKQTVAGVPKFMPDSVMHALRAWAGQVSPGQSRRLPGVLVLGQPLVAEPGGGNDFTLPDYEDQYAEVWQILAEANRDLLIVSGDVHHSRLLEIRLLNGRVLYEFTSSPAAHIPSVSDIVTGGWGVGGQDRSFVEFPTRVAGTGLSVQPEVRYLIGTHQPNSVGTLSFAGPDARVSVTARFHDLDDRGALAATSMANVGFFGGGLSPSRPTCEYTIALDGPGPS
ncbi:MAG: alkaline phosphatase D family protein [Planctomycetes bacterium]|nr:alkaline phosphatase D family protein [Planctomycetota bacterium]